MIFAFAVCVVEIVNFYTFFILFIKCFVECEQFSAAGLIVRAPKQERKKVQNENAENEYFNYF